MDEQVGFEKLIFSNFCKLCESISKCSNVKLKIRSLKEYINSLRKKCPEANFHILLRFLLPNLDRERGPYGIKEHNLAKIYIRVLDLPKEGKDASMLLNFRNPTNTAAINDKMTDFAQVAYWVLQNKCGESTNIKLGEVNTYLDRLAEEHAAHNPRAVDDLLIEIFRKMSAIEQKWFMRLILKSMHLGLGVKNILNTYHPDSMELFDVSSSLLKVCTCLKDENIRLHELDLTLFEPFRPMLSDRCDISKMNFSGEYFIDEKLDGERFQIHYLKGKFKYFSRNGFDFTDNYGADKDCGYFTSQINERIKNDVESFILDGEMMGWHTSKKCFLTKASNIDVKALRVGNPIQPCFSTFDIVYFNGKVLTNKPLFERLGILEKIFEPREGVIVHTPRIKVFKNEDILNALNNAIDRQHEGIVLKDPNSFYKANSRKCGWYKIKPEYSDGALVELDLLIIGGYYGEGRLKGCINQFLLGLARPNNQGVQQFSSLCRVGSGYSRLELGELLSKLNPYWQKYKPSKGPQFLLLSKEKPDVWIEPCKSYILQVKASEVIRSDHFHFGYSLRFPRVENVRYDKQWNDCLTTNSFTEIVKTYTAKLISGHVKKKRDAQGNMIDTTLLEKSVEKVGNIFLDKEICVMTGDDTLSKDILETIILEQNGSLVNIPGLKTYCVIAGSMNVRVKNVITARKHIVAKPKWVQHCLDAGKLIPFASDLILSAPLRKKVTMSKTSKLDITDSSVTTVESLKSLVERIPASSELKNTLSDKSVLEFDQKLFGKRSPYSLFRGLHVYFFKSSQEPSTEELIFTFLSGIIDDFYSERTDYIIITKMSPQASSFIKSMYEEKSLDHILIVSNSWIMDCFKRKQLMDAENYILTI